MIDAGMLCFSDLEDKDLIVGVEDDDHIFGNKIGKNIYVEYKSNDISTDQFDNDSTIASLARVDVWMVMISKLAFEERKKGICLQKKYAETQSKYLPLAVQQILLKVRGAIHMFKENEITIRMSCAAIL